MRWLHILSSASVSFSHGGNDGQKTMGIITLILATHFPQFGYKTANVTLWVIVAAALAISSGTMTGGWKVIRTVGTKISRERLSHSQGVGAAMSTAIIILLLFASQMGAPISTTHTLSSAVAGGTIPVHGAGKLECQYHASHYSCLGAHSAGCCSLSCDKLLSASLSLAYIVIFCTAMPGLLQGRKANECKVGITDEIHGSIQQSKTVSSSSNCGCQTCSGYRR